MCFGLNLCFPLCVVSANIPIAYNDVCVLTYLFLHEFTLIVDSVTRNYFENLVRALENGLSDVDAHGASSRSTSSKNLGGSKSRNGRGRGASSKPSSSSRNVDDSSHWSCEHCTFANVKSATICQMCHNRRWIMPYTVGAHLEEKLLIQTLHQLVRHQMAINDALMIVAHLFPTVHAYEVVTWFHTEIARVINCWKRKMPCLYVSTL